MNNMNNMKWVVLQVTENRETIAHVFLIIFAELKYLPKKI